MATASQAPARRVLPPIAAGLALATLLAASAAHSQSLGDAYRAYVAPPAEHLSVTPGGVDIRTGRYAYSQTDLSIGGEGDAGLALTRTANVGIPGHTNPFANFSHNWDIMVTEKRVDINAAKFQAGSGQDYRIGVRYGGRSETFDAAYGSASSQQTSQTSQAVLSFAGDRASAGVVYTFQANDGTIAIFRPLGSRDCSIEDNVRCAYVSEITLPEGTRFSFEYEVPGGANTTRLRSVISNRGYALLLEYGGTGGGPNHVSKGCVLNLASAPKPAGNVCPAGAPTSSYAFTGTTGRLLSATDATGAQSSFTYAFVDGITRMGFVKPGQASAWLTNYTAPAINPDGGLIEIVQEQHFADGQAYGYSYHGPEIDTQDTVHELAGGSYADATGATTSVQYAFPQRPESSNPPRFDQFRQPVSTYGDAYYQVTPGPVSVTDPLGRTTTFDYCDAYLAQALPSTDTHRCVVTLLQSYTDPAGIRTELTYGWARNVMQVRRKEKAGSGLADIVLSASYDCSSPKICAKPSSIADANGNTSLFAYSPVHGGILTETQPAVNGVTPQKRYAYTQRTAWISNGAGGYVAAGPPVWLLTQVSQCKAGNPASSGTGCANGTADEVVTTYDYGPDAGPNNLLLRGIVVDAAGLSLRTCYAYDALGNRLSETRPRAGLASCP
jgi:hypothetical protein